MLSSVRKTYDTGSVRLEVLRGSSSRSLGARWSRSWGRAGVERRRCLRAGAPVLKMAMAYPLRVRFRTGVGVLSDTAPQNMLGIWDLAADGGRAVRSSRDTHDLPRAADARR